MIGFNKTMVTSIILYATLVLISFFGGSLNEHFGYALFLSSSAFFSARIAYQTWKESKPLKDIQYPIENAASNQKEFSDAIRSALSGKSSPTYVVSRLQNLLIKKLSLKLNLTEAEAEKLLQNPEKLRGFGYDKLVFLINEDTFATKTRSERIKLLDTILRLLEED